MKGTEEKIEKVTYLSGRDGRGLIVIHGLYVSRITELKWDIWVTDLQRKLQFDRNLVFEQEDEDQG